MTNDRNQLQKATLATGLILGLVCLAAAPAWAQTTEEQVRMLLEQNAQQQRQIDQLRAMVAAQSGQSTGEAVASVMHDQILDLSVVDERVQEAIAREMEEGELSRRMPGWLDGLVFKADLRLRYEGIFFEDNATFPQDRNRGRFRLRFGMDKTWGSNKDWLAGFRLVSGGLVTSSNQTFGGLFVPKPVWIDRAFVRWKPTEGLLKGLELQGGKMANPFQTTWNHWDTDVSPEGAFEKYTFDFGAIKPYVNFGQFFLRENSRRPSDLTLLAYGGGFTSKFEDLGNVQFNSAVNYYDYQHLDENLVLSPGNPVITLPDGSMRFQAERFSILDWVWEVKGKAFDVDWTVYGNVAGNIGFGPRDRDDGMDEEDDENWSVGVVLGKNKRQGDASVEWAYAENDPNSGLGALMDSDLGFAGRRGWVIRSFYNLTDFAKIGGSYFDTDGIEAAEDVDRRQLLQLDLSVKF